MPEFTSSTLHFIKKCRGCQTVVSQCRCPGPNKRVEWVDSCPACPPTPRGFVNDVLYCYGGCGRRYEDFGLDVMLPTPLWNRIAVGAPFDETQTNIEREGRGGVLCAQCIVNRLLALPGVTVALMTTDAEPGN
jgi:hypothetical protein